MKNIILFFAVIVVAGCQSLPPPVCTAIANIGGQETTVSIYGVRKQANQTQYYAGAPFGWKWISATNFTSSACNK